MVTIFGCDSTAAEMKDVWGAFVAMMRGIANLPGVRVLGNLDDDQIMVGPSVAFPWTTYVLADVPDIELYAIDASFDAHPSAAERDYLNEMPTSWVLSDEQVDRLRAAAAEILRTSGEYKRMLQDIAAKPAARGWMAR